jgi:hypothetical protein
LLFDPKENQLPDQKNLPTFRPRLPNKLPDQNILGRKKLFVTFCYGRITLKELHICRFADESIQIFSSTHLQNAFHRYRFIRKSLKWKYEFVIVITQTCELKNDENSQFTARESTTG